MEQVRLLKIPTPPAFAYYSDRMLSGISVQVDEIRRMPPSYFVLFGLIFFLSAARDGVICNKASDPRIRSNRYRFLVPLPAAFVSFLESFGLFHVVCA